MLQGQPNDLHNLLATTLPTAMSFSPQNKIHIKKTLKALLKTILRHNFRFENNMNIRNEAGRMLSIDRVSENYVLGNVNDVQLHYPSSIFVVCRLPLLPSTPKEHIASATLSQTLHFCHFLKHLPCFFSISFTSLALSLFRVIYDFPIFLCPVVFRKGTF